MGKTILIISHENEPLEPPYKHLIHRVRESWQRDGWTVLDARGTKKRIPADVAFLHVDLSVVPQEYVDFARSYPVAINAGIRDIRKSVVGRIRVLPGDGYAGPVIVKSALNSAGIPEHRLGLGQRSWLSAIHGELLAAIAPKWKLKDYPIYPSADDVPPAVFRSDDVVVERFLPEVHDGLYCLREWYFLGDASVNRAELWRGPVISSGNAAPDLVEPTPPEVISLRRELGIDYGKIDYTMHEGRPVVFDVNKTVGTGTFMSDAATALAQTLAKGLDSLLR